MANKFYKYVMVYDSEKGSYLDVVENSNYYYNATNKDTVRFFKSFGKCFFRHNDHCDTFYTECNGNFKRYNYYNSLSDLIKYEDLEIKPLPVGRNTKQASFYNKAFLIVDKNGINKGLQSYNELVASFIIGDHIRFFGYFSATTTKHQDAYAFPVYCKYRFKSKCEKINKDFLTRSSSLYFEDV